MKILALDTSGLVASAAVAEDDILRAEFSIQNKVTHSQVLMPMVDDIKTILGLELSTIDAIAIAQGPGSFTGLRIGAATAKGLALALNVPIIGIPTVDGLAYNMYGTSDLVCPILDARRKQVYTGLYEFVSDDESHEYDMNVVMEQCSLPIDELASKINEMGRAVTFLGDGVRIHRQYLDEALTVPHHYAPLHHTDQSAAAICALSFKYAQEGKVCPADDFAPDYLKVSQAERQAAEGKASPKGVTDEDRLKKARRGLREEMIRIREMTAADLHAAAEIEHNNLGKEAWNYEQIKAANERDDTIYLVAEKHGDIIGLCGLQNISGDGEITNVSVMPEFRHEGAATKMLRQLLERGKGLGCTAYTLEVRAHNTHAIALYEKLGFKSEGIRPNFYDNPKDDAAIYWKRTI